MNWLEAPEVAYSEIQRSNFSYHQQQLRRHRGGIGGLSPLQTMQ